jgi:alkylated DNA nucleotide flippase Atl1
VREAVRTLKADGQVVTQKAIGEIVGMSESGMRRYPRARALLLELVPQTKDERARQRSVEQKAFVKRVLGIIAKLEKRGDKVTYKALEALSGRTTGTLRSYPRIKAAVEILPANRRNWRRGSKQAS